MSNPALTANYTSPSSTHLFTSQLPSQPASSSTQTVQEKTEFLQALRTGISQIQGEINAFLTKRMEDEKAAADAASGVASAREQKEEEMYGEEDPEADDV